MRKKQVTSTNRSGLRSDWAAASEEELYAMAEELLSSPSLQPAPVPDDITQALLSTIWGDQGAAVESQRQESAVIPFPQEPEAAEASEELPMRAAVGDDRPPRRGGGAWPPLGGQGDKDQPLTPRLRLLRDTPESRLLDKRQDRLSGEELTIELVKLLGIDPAVVRSAVALVDQDAPGAGNPEHYAEILDLLLSRLNRLARSLIDVPVSDKYVDDTPILRLRDVLLLYLTFFLAWPIASELHCPRPLEIDDQRRRGLEYRLDLLGEHIFDQLYDAFRATLGMRRHLDQGNRVLQPLKTDKDLRLRILRAAMSQLDGISEARYSTKRGLNIFRKLTFEPNAIANAEDMTESLIRLAGGRLGLPLEAERLCRSLERPAPRTIMVASNAASRLQGPALPDPWFLLADRAPGIHQRLDLAGGVTYCAMGEHKAPKEIWLYEPASLSHGVSVTEMVRLLLARRPSCLFISTDVHLNTHTLQDTEHKSHPRRFTIQDRGSRHADNLLALRRLFPEARLVSMGVSLGTLVTIHACLLLAGRLPDHRVRLVSMPYNKVYPSPLRLLTGIYQLIEPQPRLWNSRRVRDALHRTSIHLVTRLGFIVDDCYPPKHRTAMRRYWADALASRQIRPLSLSIEAQSMLNAYLNSEADEFYEDLHEIVDTHPDLRLLIDPLDQLFPGSSRWEGRSVTQIPGIGHSPVDVPRLDPQFVRWLLE